MKKSRIIKKLIVFLVRMMLGAVLIHFMNQIFIYNGMSEMVIGINPVSVLTSGILGIPGVALLFSLMFIKSL